MAEIISYTDLATKAGISPSYANQIINGARTPPRPLAIHIYNKTNWKHDSIAALTDEQIDMLAALDPWTPQDKRPDASEAA
ncbi:helix-turn-helix domain-containing protein [Qipengyuania sp. MTN3-11]|uniref:helix-turn-helix domain-containing protein n=1 Tax=Qipengyuania sp. MTN3-11 TaxID=3056557 RepID=UPI0036F2766A